MPETIILALLFAKLKKYKIKELFTLWEFYVILSFEVFLAIVQINVFLQDFGLLRYMSIIRTVYLCSYLFLVFRFRIYKSAIVGSGFLVLGSVLNQVVIAANGGRMPVFPTLSKLTGYISGNQPIETIDNIHKFGTQAVSLLFLTDIIDLGYSVLSIGDIFIRLFAFIIIYNSIKRLNMENSLVEEKSSAKIA